MMLNLNDKYVVNPNYHLKHDQTRSIISTIHHPEFGRYRNIRYTDNFFAFIHPFLAAILSYFNGKMSLGEQLSLMKQEIGVEPEMVMETVNQKHLDNLNLIIKYDNSIPIREIDSDMFYFEKLDLETPRLNEPLNFTLMVNTKCVTNCVYCYADRRLVHSELSIDRMRELIQEAKKLNMSFIDVLGGEFFLYPNWYELLKILMENGFHPYISTKVPLTKEQVQKIKELGLEYIQVSFDSIDENELTILLRTKLEYKEKMLKTIEYLNQANIKIIVHSILTSINSNENNILKLLDYLSSIEYVDTIRFTPVGYTRYKSIDNFSYIKPENKKISKIEQIIEQYNSTYPTKRYSIGVADSYKQYECSLNDKNENFKNRNTCVGNLRNFYVLPDGKVTFCEQLYWDKNFIIGDLSKQSIMEMWTSPQALNFAKNKKKVLTEKSFCYFCKDFDECHNYRGVCWKLVVENYGTDNWYFPDPRCPHAPTVSRALYYD